MSADLLARIERDINKIGEELWNFDGPSDALDNVLKRVSFPKAQLGIQSSLQATANLLRRVPTDKALPKQQATKVKHLVRFAFRQNERQEFLGRKTGKDGRHQKLRKLDCDALKFCGLSYTIEEIVKLGNAEFEILQKGVAEFVCQRNLSCLLYRSDVDKAVDAKLGDPEDDKAFDKFILSPTKKKHGTNMADVYDETDLNPAPAKTKTNKYDGDVFIVNLNDARYALSLEKDVGEVWLTNRKNKKNGDSDKKSFLTLWVSEAMGEELGRRSKLMVKYTSDNDTQ